jgi:hypothetical protein
MRLSHLTPPLELEQITAGRRDFSTAPPADVILAPTTRSIA